MEIQEVSLLESQIYSYQLKESDAQRLNSLMLDIDPEECHIDFSDGKEKEAWLYKVIHNFSRDTDTTIDELDVVQTHKDGTAHFNVEGDKRTIIVVLANPITLTLESEREKRVLDVSHGTVVIIPINVAETYAADVAVKTNTSGTVLIMQ